MYCKELVELASRFAHDQVKMKWPRLIESGSGHYELALNIFTIQFYHYFFDELLNFAVPTNFKLLWNFDISVIEKKYSEFNRWIQYEYQSLFPSQPKQTNRRITARRRPNS